MPAATTTHAEDLADFVDASPSSYHAAAEVARRLLDAGFTSLHESDAWPQEPGRYVVVREGAVIAWAVPTSAGPTTPVRVFGAHSDSPGFKLKPQPTTGHLGWLQAGVEVYGGPLVNSWLDRELRLAGRLVLEDGTEVLADSGPLLRLPQLAIHLDREVNERLTLDRQVHTQPVWGVGAAESADLIAELADRVGVDAARVRGYDLVTADSARGAVFGRDDVFFAAGRLDDLASAHAGTVALAEVGDDLGADHIPMLAVFDHEEVGSASRTKTDIIDQSGSGAFTLGAATTFHVIPSANVGIVVLTNAAPIGVPELLAAEFAGASVPSTC